MKRPLLVRSFLALALLPLAVAAAPRAPAAPASVPWAGIGRAATPAEVAAWNIDVRGDFQGLPKGAGSVDLGTTVWEAKCASCHGEFAESNQVFTPIVGGTSKKDIESGHTWFLSHPGYPHRTTLMKISHLSSIWDYVNRAMPWNAPKSLKTDEVYGVLAYILNLGDIVPADFTLSDANIAEVEKRLPNRYGHVFFKSMWQTRGKGDVSNPLCMRDCPVEGRIESSIPAAAMNSNGNIADQVRPFGPERGTDTARIAALAGGGADAAAPSAAGPAPAVAATPQAASIAATPAGVDVQALIKANGCTGCHGIDQKIVGPAFREVAQKHVGSTDLTGFLAARIRNGGQGTWGAIPMPAQPQLSEADARAIAHWIANGAR
ncbi:MAG TPA: c-type cytochrome [Caldimonas sp.]|nr:c-type cytochrome [Caldimonas sp.]